MWYVNCKMSVCQSQSRSRRGRLIEFLPYTVSFAGVRFYIFIRAALNDRASSMKILTRTPTAYTNYVFRPLSLLYLNFVESLTIYIYAYVLKTQCGSFSTPSAPPRQVYPTFETTELLINYCYVNARRRELRRHLFFCIHAQVRTHVYTFRIRARCVSCLYAIWFVVFSVSALYASPNSRDSLVKSISDIIATNQRVLFDIINVFRRLQRKCVYIIIACCDVQVCWAGRSSKRFLPR